MTGDEPQSHSLENVSALRGRVFVAAAQAGPGEEWGQAVPGGARTLNAY